MKIQIKHRFENKVLFDCDRDSIKLAVELAVKNKVNLYGADLSGADLRGAYLYGADLSGAKGIFSFTLGQHFGFCFKFKSIVYIKIGCITKTIADWIKCYKAVGKENGYTPSQIQMYGEIIKLFNKNKRRMFLHAESK